MNLFTFFLLSSKLVKTYAIPLLENNQYESLQPRADTILAECSVKTDTAVWYGNQEYEMMAAFSLEEAVPITSQCRESSLLKRQHQLQGNKFNMTCKPEMQSKKTYKVTHVDVMVPVNGQIQSVATPGGGKVEMQADNYEDRDNSGRTTDLLRVTVRNRSQCPIRLEWLTHVRIFSNRRNDPDNMLAARSLDPTPLREWTTNPNGCELSNLERVAQVAIAVRLIITAFGYC